MTAVEQLNPGNLEHIVWDPQIDGIGRSEPAEIAKLTKRYNQLNMGQHLLCIRGFASVGQDETTGLAHATFRDRDDSTEAMVVHGHPFTNDMSDNMLLRADFIYKALKELGVRDANGDPLPLMSIAMPGPNSRMRFACDRATNRSILKHEINEGNFMPAAELHLDLVRRVHPRVGTLGRIGFSADACIIPVEAGIAASMSLDMTHIGMGDPVNVIDRTKKELLVDDFGPESKVLKENVARAGIQAFIDVHKGDSNWGFMKTVLSEWKTNKAIGTGMTTSGFALDLIEAVNAGAIATVGVTNGGRVSPFDATMEAVDYARTRTGEKVYSVQIGDTMPETHCVGDQIGVLSTFYAYALTR